jgi:hypothetical protein
VASNLCEDVKTLSIQTVKGICRIFYEFIEIMAQRGQGNEEILIDIVKGLSKLSAATDPDVLEAVSGID